MQTLISLSRTLSLRTALLLCSSALILVPGAAVGQNLSIHLDPAGTQIRFTVKSLLHNVHGTFQLKGGMVAANSASGLAQGEVLVDATTGKTGSAATDRRMQQVLESDRYPALFFHAEHLRGPLPASDGAADLTADGTFNIHGADHPIQLKLHLERHGTSVTVTTRFAIPYVAWGMRDPSTGLTRYGKQVWVDIAANGTVATTDSRSESKVPASE